MKKVVLWFLILALLVGAGLSLCACGGSKEPEPSTDSSQSGDTEESEDDRLDVPDKQFNTTFIILGTAEWDAGPDDTDIVARAQYLRNSYIEKRFGVTLVQENLEFPLIPNAVADAAKAGDASVYDLVVSQICPTASNLVLNRNCVDWYDLPYVNLDNPWWPATNREDLTMKDQCYMVLGDFALSSIGHTYCLYFNKMLAEKYELGDLYQLTKDGGFTYDALLTMVKDVWEDTDQSGSRNSKDTYGMQYGMLSDRCVSNAALVFGFDIPIFQKDPETGVQVLSLYDGKSIAIMEKVLNFYYKTTGVRHLTNPSTSEFVNGLGIFTNGILDSMIQDFRDLDDLGLLPMPKWNAEQIDYYSAIGLVASVLLIPDLHGNEAKMEKVGAVMEMMSYLSYRDVRPVYYKKVLNGKDSDTSPEAEMIDLIVGARHADFSYYMEFDSPAFTLSQMITNHNPQFLYAWALNKMRYKTKLEQVFAAFGLEFNQPLD